MKKIIGALFIFMLVTQGVSYSQTFKIIVNQKNASVSLSKKEISDLFLKKKIRWGDGTIVAPVDLNANSKIREDFSQQVLGKGISAIRNFWQQAAFSGSASAPPEKNNDAEVIEYVQKNLGGIGYVSDLTKTESVKTVNVN